MTILPVALLTVSDSRSLEDDPSGDLLRDSIVSAGHRLMDRFLVRDDVYAIRAQVSSWIADPSIQVIITTGGTGFTGRDSTPEALLPLFDKEINGFGELFRQLSYAEVGTSTLQSRATGGIANGTLIFALPGSKGAVTLGWNEILLKQLDSGHRPCNFAELIPRFLEHLKIPGGDKTA